MRTILFALGTTVITGVSAFSQNESMPHLISELRKYIEEERINPMNYPFMVKDIPRFQELVKLVSTRDPNQVAAMIDESSDIQIQILIVLAAQHLKPRDYLNVVEEIVNLATRKDLACQIVSSAISPQEQLPFLLSDNFQDEQVIRILVAARPIFKDEPRSQEAIDMMLSGQVKADRDRRRETTFPNEAAPPPPIRLDEDRNDSP